MLPHGAGRLFHSTRELTRSNRERNAVFRGSVTHNFFQRNHDLNPWPKNHESPNGVFDTVWKLARLGKLESGSAAGLTLRVRGCSHFALRNNKK